MGSARSRASPGRCCRCAALRIAAGRHSRADVLRCAGRRQRRRRTVPSVSLSASPRNGLKRPGRHALRRRQRDARGQRCPAVRKSLPVSGRQAAAQHRHRCRRVVRVHRSPRSQHPLPRACPSEAPLDALVRRRRERRRDRQGTRGAARPCAGDDRRLSSARSGALGWVDGPLVVRERSPRPVRSAPRHPRAKPQSRRRDPAHRGRPSGRCVRLPGLL